MSPEASSFRAMGVDVVVGGADEDELAAVQRLFEEWDGVFSRFRADSELARVNDSSSRFVVVSRTFARAVRASLAAAETTHGLVDPTLGVAIEAVGYDRDFSVLSDDDRPVGPPVPGDWRRVRITGRLLSRAPGTSLDLNGVVKALAVDSALRLIAGDGFVAAGGDVAMRGSAVVGLATGGSVRVHGGVATSGTTERTWRRGGEVQHHLLDPRTGRPAVSRWTQVTVAARDCLTADVAAKAAFLLSDDGPAWLDERGLPGIFAGGDDVVANRVWRDALGVAA